MIHGILNTICLSMILIMTVSGCSRNEENSGLLDSNKVIFPEQEAWQSKLMLTKSGQKQAVVRFGHMVKYQDDETIYLDDGVDVDFYNKDGKHTSNLISDKAEYLEKTQDVRAIGHVVVVSDSGVTLKTSELRWDSQIEKILSDSLVMLITEQQDTLFGRGFAAESDLSRRVIREPWGVSNRSIDFSKFEEAFQRPESSEDISGINQDTLSRNYNVHTD